jgi:DNA recombination-dependent growth factor C
MISGSLSLKRFQILPLHSHIDFTFITKMVQKYTIQPLELQETREEACGFCHPITGDTHLESLHSLVFENNLFLGFRSDRKKISSTYLKIQIENALQNLGYSLENEYGKKNKIPKKMRDSIKETMLTELLKTCPPHVRITELLWNLESNEILFLSQSQSAVQEFQKIFFEAFQVPLIHKNTGIIPIPFDLLGTSRTQAILDPLIQTLPSIFMTEEQNPTPQSFSLRDYET